MFDVMLATNGSMVVLRKLVPAVASFTRSGAQRPLRHCTTRRAKEELVMEFDAIAQELGWTDHDARRKWWSEEKQAMKDRKSEEEKAQARKEAGKKKATKASLAVE